MPMLNLTLPLNLTKATLPSVKRTVCPTFTWMRSPRELAPAVLARFVLDFFGFRFLLRTLLDLALVILALPGLRLWRRFLRLGVDGAEEGVVGGDRELSVAWKRLIEVAMVTTPLLRVEQKESAITMLLKGRL